MLDLTSIPMTCSRVSKGLSDCSREFYELTMPTIDIFENEDGNDLVINIDLPREKI
jgi:hypothetical protein